MQNRRIALTILFIMAFFYSANFCYSLKIFEQSLEDLGYAGFEVERGFEESCREYPIKVQSYDGYSFITILAVFTPNNNGTANVECYIDGSLIGLINAKDFDCNTGLCVYYLPVDKNKIVGEHKLKFCLRPSQSIVKIALNNQTKIGLYLIGIFKGEDFRKCVVIGNECLEKYSAVVGEDLNVKIILKNSGNYESKALIYAVRPVLPEKETRKELSELTFLESFRAGEEKAFYYSVRVKSSSADIFNLPPAAAYYTDEFGREIVVFSNPVTILKKNEPEVDAKILAENVEKKGEFVPVFVVISNSSGVELTGVEVMLLGNNVIYEPEKQIFSVSPRNSYTAQFYVRSVADGKVGCTVKIPDYNMVLNCNTVDISKSEANIIPFLFFGALLVILALAVYLYLNSLPE